MDDIKDALAANDSNALRQAFRALVDYPKEAAIVGLAAGNAMATLDALVERLWGDYSQLPAGTCEALNVLPSSRYCDGATMVANSRQRFADHFSMIFRGQ
jgi:hypothetical protein